MTGSSPARLTNINIYMNILERTLTGQRNEHDYPNDDAHYCNMCGCGAEFIGYKYANTCYKCHTEYQEFLNSMTEKEREEYEVKKFMELIDKMGH